MSGFLDLKRIEVPLSAIDEANSHLRRVGWLGREGFSLWAGRRVDETFIVEKNIVPAQVGHRLESGVCVTVGPDELHRINVWLYEHKMTLVAQLHSHPTDAYHSDTDDAFPIATTTGSLSIVIPDYARHPFSFERCAVYRLIPEKGWVYMETSEVLKLISIDENK